jgi:hypothetical protein
LIYSERSETDKKFHRGKDAIAAITKLLMNYDMYKKRIIMRFNLKPAQLYALLYFSTGEKKGTDFYERDFKYSYNSSRADMFNGLNELYQNGYVSRRSKPHKYTLTAKGTDMLGKIMEQIIEFYKL